MLDSRVRRVDGWIRLSLTGWTTEPVAPTPRANLRTIGTTIEAVPADVPYLWAEAERVRAWATRLDECADTSAVDSLLDPVITVDTSVGHLAGVLGRPTWILPWATHHERWLLDREDTPW